MESKEKLMPAEIAFGQIMTAVDIANHAFYEGTIKRLVLLRFHDRTDGRSD